MALAGHDIVVTAATGASVTAIALDGIKSITVSDSRDLLDVTDFADGNVRARIAALRDYSVSMSGDFEPADTGYLLVKACYENGNTLWVRKHMGGAAGASVGFMYPVLIESLEVTGAVEGKLELSVSTQASTGTTPFTHA